jgi:hypothetical protein
MNHYHHLENKLIKMKVLILNQVTSIYRVPKILIGIVIITRQNMLK